jgi:hypothetical protein
MKTSKMDVLNSTLSEQSMRLELNFLLFIVFLIATIVFWLIYKRQRYGKTIAKIFLILCWSLMLPAFIPGHGELIVALPNGALFGKFTDLTWIVGLFFVFLYSWVVFFILKVSNDEGKHNNRVNSDG